LEHPKPAKIRVMVADDDQAVLDYVRLVLEYEGDDLEVVGVARDAGSTVDQVIMREPDVLLLDLHMPGGGVRAAQLISSLGPSTKVLVFTADAESDELLALLRSGISGYLPKTTPPEQLAAAVRGAAAGRLHFAEEVTGRAVQELTRRLHRERNEELLVEQARRRIERVIRTRSFEMVVQPIVDLATGRVAAVEALTRFIGPPERPPLAWFEEAAATARGTELELATASAALELLDALDEGLAMSINLSPTAVLSGRLGMLLRDVDPSRVIVELTEHAAVEDYGFLNMTLDRWREQGLRTAVDDAGAGYASLSHILELRPDIVKLDLSVVGNIDDDDGRRSLARALIGFADDLGIPVVAEGVENRAELDAVAALGARYGQGFHLGHPLPLDEQPRLQRQGRRLQTASSPAIERLARERPEL
jgi:EAL domain-containing protein (putative c-di-GMP-specific phosphodiesterase class I)/CheY-like chemotaxis protein